MSRAHSVLLPSVLRSPPRAFDTFSAGPATKFSSAYLRLPADPLTPSAKDDAEEYTSSWDLTAPGVVSTDVSPVKSDKVSAEILNRTPREQRREDLKKITSVKKLNRCVPPYSPPSFASFTAKSLLV